MDPVPDVISSYIDAYNSKNIANILACFSDDVQFINMSGDEISVEVRGKPDFRLLAEQGIELFSERHQAIKNCICLGSHVSLRIKFSAVVAKDLPNGWKAGQKIEIEGVSLFTLANGRIEKLIDMA